LYKTHIFLVFTDITYIYSDPRLLKEVGDLVVHESLRITIAVLNHLFFIWNSLKLSSLRDAGQTILNFVSVASRRERHFEFLIVNNCAFLQAWGVVL
jgi:hypothetical protein